MKLQRPMDLKLLYTVYSDGAARGNPGPAGAGAVIFDADNNLVHELEKYLGHTTNNVAEYEALLLALEKLVAMQVSHVTVYADSELMVKQIRGEYRVKNSKLVPLYQKAKALIKNISHFDIEHVPRERNKAADRLANHAIDYSS
jgi:ribonuclease HI